MNGRRNNNNNITPYTLTPPFPIKRDETVIFIHSQVPEDCSERGSVRLGLNIEKVDHESLTPPGGNNKKAARAAACGVDQPPEHSRAWLLHLIELRFQTEQRTENRNSIFGVYIMSAIYFEIDSDKRWKQAHLVCTT